MPQVAEQILIIEDDRQIVSMLTRILEGAGYPVSSACLGIEALESVLKNRPSLVILDLKLPDIDGYQVCRRLKQLYPPSQIPVLILTGMSQPVDQLRGFAHGADAYLTKPCTPAELLRTITTLFEQSHTSPDPQPDFSD